MSNRTKNILDIIVCCVFIFVDIYFYNTATTPIAKAFDGWGIVVFGVLLNQVLGEIGK